MVVEHKPGAGTTLAATTAKAKPDGYTFHGFDSPL
jgi:tripartite-type tricarboxylate transporter receptor subunit TctC